LYATGFRDPRFLLSAPNGDIFVVESRGNQINVLRDTNGDGKPDVIEIFAERNLNKPFGIAFYPPGDDPQFLRAPTHPMGNSQCGRYRLSASRGMGLLVRRRHCHLSAID
jgi:hypothetical protein